MNVITNPLTQAEAERLGIMVDSAIKLAEVGNKILADGWEGSMPNAAGGSTPINHRVLLADAMAEAMTGGLLCAMAKDVDPDMMESLVETKGSSLRERLQYQSAEVLAELFDDPTGLGSNMPAKPATKLELVK